MKFKVYLSVILQNTNECFDPFFYFLKVRLLFIYALTHGKKNECIIFLACKYETRAIRFRNVREFYYDSLTYLNYFLNSIIYTVCSEYTWKYSKSPTSIFKLFTIEYFIFLLFYSYLCNIFVLLIVYKFCNNLFLFLKRSSNLRQMGKYQNKISKISNILASYTWSIYIILKCIELHRFSNCIEYNSENHHLACTEVFYIIT